MALEPDLLLWTRMALCQMKKIEHGDEQNDVPMLTLGSRIFLQCTRSEVLLKTKNLFQASL